MRVTTVLLRLATLATLTAPSIAQKVQPVPAGHSSPASHGSTTGPIYIYPLEAKLVHTLDSANVTPGQHVLTTLTHIWTDGDCTLTAGAALSGEITAVHQWTREDRQTRITIVFRYSCHDEPRTLRLITLLAPENPDLLGIHGNPVEMQAMRSSLYGEGDPFRPAGNTPTNHVDMTGQQNPQMPLFVSSEPSTDHRPTEVKRGMVWHLPGIALSLSDAKPPITSIVSSHRSIKLPGETVFVMQPNLEAGETVSRPGAAAGAFAATSTAAVTIHPRLPALAPEINACPAATCSDLGSAAPVAVSPARQLALRRYGSVRGQSGEIPGLEYSAAVAFLGTDELLVCVGKPGLVQRNDSDRPEDHPHLVEAVLYNRSTGHVERSVEWSIPNRDRYLWPLTGGRVLVHQGGRLVWYGPGLVPEHTMALPQPLAFVHTTGDGRHLLVGTIRELHTTPEHAELYRNDSRAPEEEVVETVYDGDFHPISEHRESSRALPPLLWNTGRITLRHRSKELWYFRETAWDGTERNFGTLTSSCVPQTSALSGDMLLVVGCETHSLNDWVHILRPDGTIVLRSIVHPSDLFPVASTVSPGNILLVSPRLNAAANRDGALHAADITSESIRVLRLADGHLKFATDIHSPTTSAQPAALDPNGSTLAILDGDAVRLYTIPVESAATAREHASN